MAQSLQFRPTHNYVPHLRGRVRKPRRAIPLLISSLLLSSRARSGGSDRLLDPGLHVGRHVVGDVLA